MNTITQQAQRPSVKRGLKERTLMAILVSLALVAAAGCGSVTEEASPPDSAVEPAPVEEPESREPVFSSGTAVGLEQLAVMNVEAGPKSVELMPPDGKRVFVNDLYANKSFIFDADSYELLKAIPLPDEPVEADFTSDGRMAWVSLHNSSKVLVIDTESGTIIGESPTGSIPKAVAVSPDDKWVYVANWNSNTVSVIDTGTFQTVRNIPVPGTPRGICFEPDGDFAYVCIMGGSVLCEVDVNAGHEVTRHIPSGSNPRHVVPSKDGSVLYVSNNSPGTVTLIDRRAGAIQAVIKVGRQARTITLAPDGRYLFVCNYGEDTVGCVDLHAREQIFTVPTSDPIGIASSATGDRVFVSNYAPPHVTVMRVVREQE